MTLNYLNELIKNILTNRNYITFRELKKQIIDNPSNKIQQINNNQIINQLKKLKQKGFITSIGKDYYCLKKGDLTPHYSSIEERISQNLNAPINNNPHLLIDYFHNIIRTALSFEIEKSSSIDSIENLKTILMDYNLIFIINGQIDFLKNISYEIENLVFFWIRKQIDARYEFKLHNNYKIAVLEKIIVDTYFNTTKRNFIFPLNELGYIIENIVDFKLLNIPKLLRLATRKYIDQELREILKHFDLPEELIRGESLKNDNTKEVLSSII